MKRLFAIMNLILCLELIIGPHFPGARMFTLDVARAQETCPAGLVMDSTLNRCITSDQQAAVINATYSCNGDKECYKRLAEEELKKGEEEGKIEEQLKDKGGLFNKGLKVAAIAVPLMIGAQSLMTAKCMAPSTMVMVASGAALFLGDMMANKKHKSCLKKIEDDWEKKKAATAETTTSGISKVSMAQAQSEAFEMLAKKEECMQSAAKMKSGFYMAGTLGFAAAAVLGYMEETKMKALLANPPTHAAGVAYSKVVLCPGAIKASTDNSPDKYLQSILPVASDLPSLITLMQFQQENFWEKRSSPSIDHYEFNKNLFGSNAPEEKSNFQMMKTAMTTVLNQLDPIPRAEAFVAGPNPIGGSMLRPIGRAIVSGVLGVWAFMMMQHAKKQAKVSGNRAEFLRNMKKEFDDANGAISCSAEERTMSANANCYCYTEGGQRNPQRNNSQVCQQLWATQGLAQAGSYENLDFSNQRVCIAANGTADENCSCKATQNCMNAIPSSGNLGLGAIGIAGQGMKPLNDLMNGQIGAGSINSQAAGSLAAKLLDEKNKLAAKAKVNPNDAKKIAKQVEGSLITAGAGQPSPISSPSPLPMNMSPADAARALEKDLNNQRDFEKINGSPALAQPGNSKIDGDGLSVVNPEAAAPMETQLAEAMAQDLDYGASDVTGSKTNLFEILSNRYQRSGMRRLFDDGPKAEPEKSNKNDISQ